MDYADGSEDDLYDIVVQARDLSLASEELPLLADDWPQRYHLTSSRSNVLRGFDIDPGSRVLEIGSGCGAVTRYLGESFRVVDGIEPMTARARIARSRTRDLPNVEIFIGELGDLPPRPAYDAVVIVGVLEYIARGNAEMAPYSDYLALACSMLVDGGHLFCAIENRLGVKYWAGAPEDHTHRVFDALEGYQRGTHARTFSRAELEQIFAAAGMSTSFFHAFPDYKMTRAVMADTLLLGPARDLAVKLPNFPSPDWVGDRPRLADERLLWKSLVESDVAGHFSNSFVVVASAARSGGENRVWPTGRLATFFSEGRRAAFSTSTHVTKQNEVVEFHRQRSMNSQMASLTIGALTHVTADSQFHPGREMVLCVQEEAASGELLTRWCELVVTSTQAKRIPLDLIPRNIIVDDAGSLIPIDQEWFWSGPEATAETVIHRGLMLLAHDLFRKTDPNGLTGETVEDVIRDLATRAGLSGSTWLANIVRFEAGLQAMIEGFHPTQRGWQTAVVEQRQRLEDLNRRPLGMAPLGLREHELRARAEYDASRYKRLVPEGTRRARSLRILSNTWRSVRSMTGRK